MQLQTVLLIISTILVIIAPITYILSIIKGKTKPHRMTRFILAFVLTLNVVSLLAAHGNVGTIMLAAVFFIQSFIIFAMSLWYGMGGSSVSDWICLIVASVGIAGWKLTGNPLIGVYFSILADFSAYVPAYIKTWKHPNTESPWFYLLGAIAAFLTLISYKIELSSVFQIYVVVCSLIMVIFIYRRKILKGLHS